MLGGWKRLSFKEHDVFIDDVRHFCEMLVKHKFNDEYNCYPMEVYYKEDNGKNYKILLLGKHSKKDEFKCFSSVIVFPEGKMPCPELKKDSFKVLDWTDCTELKIENELRLSGFLRKDFTPVKIFENALDGANAYVLKVDGQYVGVFENGFEFYIDCHPR